MRNTCKKALHRKNEVQCRILIFDQSTSTFPVEDGYKTGLRLDQTSTASPSLERGHYITVFQGVNNCF